MRLEYLKRKVMNQIRVLHIVPTLGYGGVAKFLLHYYEHIDKNEVCFDFVTHGKVESFHKQLEENGSHIYYIKPQHELGVWKYYKQLHDFLKYKILSLSATCVYVLQISCKSENKHP